MNNLRAIIRAKNVFTNEDIKDDLVFKNWHDFDSRIFKLTQDGCNSVDVEIYRRFSDSSEWFLDQKKTYYGANTNHEFFLLNHGAHEYRYPHTMMEEFIIHLPTKIWFSVNEAEVIHSDEIKDNTNSLFYEFSFLAFEKEYKFIALCSVMEEQKEYVMKNILIPGAQWFCDHFRERWRSDMDERAVMTYMKKIGKI